MGFYLLHCWSVCVCLQVCVLTCVALIAIVITLIAVVVLMRQRDLSAWGIYERHSTLELHK